jgi:hypothetical protein
MRIGGKYVLLTKSYIKIKLELELEKSPSVQLRSKHPNRDMCAVFHDVRVVMYTMMHVRVYKD